MLTKLLEDQVMETPNSQQYIKIIAVPVVNSRGCSPLQLSCNLIEKRHAVGYYSYTKR